MVIKLDTLDFLGTFKDWKDHTIKCVYQNSRGVIEVTLIGNKSKRGIDVYCVPTHHYCNLGCKMCHLTSEKGKKAMVPIKAEDFIEALIRTNYRWCPEGIIKNKEIYFQNGLPYNRRLKRTKNKKCLISFMGVGEPLLNLKLIQEVFKIEEIIRNACGYTEVIYAVSTMMPNENMKTFKAWAIKNKFPAKVHFSLHSPINMERKELIPSTKVEIREALCMINEYKQEFLKVEELKKAMLSFHKTEDPAEIHYTLIKGINDSERHLKELTKLLDKFKINIKFLRFNPTGDLKRSRKDKKWIEQLKEKVLDVRIKSYNPPGHQVGSSCGEFTKHYYLSDLESEDKKKEFAEWKKRHQIEK
jgi:adenine C2-methylase RlmN of 23S rRNA A2503 and tRNA A37